MKIYISIPESNIPTVMQIPSLDFNLEMSSATSPEALKLAWQWAIEALVDSKKVESSFLKELIDRNIGDLKDSNMNENVSLGNLEELVESDGLKSLSKVNSSSVVRVSENCSEKIKVDQRSENEFFGSIQQLKDNVDKTCVKPVLSLMGKPGLSQEIQSNHLHNLIDNRLNHHGDVPSSNISPRAEVHSANLHGLNQCKNDSICIVNDSSLSYGFKDKQSLEELQNGDKRPIQCILNQTYLIGKDELSEKNQPGHLQDLDDVNKLKKISNCSDKVPSSSILHFDDVSSPNIPPHTEVHSADLHGLDQCKKDSVCIVNDSTSSHGFKGKQSLEKLQNGDKKHTQRPLSRTSFLRKHGLLEKQQPCHLHDLDNVSSLKEISSCSDKTQPSSILHCDDVPSPNIPSQSGAHSADLHGFNQCKKDSVCTVNDSNLSHGFKGKSSLGEQQNRNKKNAHPSLIPVIPSGREDDEESIKQQGEHENEKTVHNSLKEAIEAFVKDKLVTSQIPDGDDETHQQMCIKCSKSDQLLVCCGDCCPIAIHESCLGSPPSFDEDTREFYCPFCSYIKAAKAYDNAKKKVYRCKEYLSSFMTGLDKVPSMKPVQSVSQKRSSSSDGDIEKHYHIEERIKRNKGNAMKETEGHNTTGEHAMKEMEGRNMAGEHAMKETEGHNMTGEHTMKETEGHNTTGEHAMNRSKPLNQEKKDELIILKDNNSSKCNGIAKSSDEVSHYIQVTKESHENIEGSNASEQHLFDENATRMNESKDQMPSSSVQIPTAKVEKEPEIYRELPEELMKEPLNFQYLYSRRKRLVWTLEEEEILKVAVRKLSNGKIRYPWLEILNYGRDVFHKSRKPTDLKDKWRNMQRKM
ncbi:hypothetical protein ZOSMA_202G00370 [Zostera marina]|uniref:Myb-like domain-containing protein n=1 Tax=Zostera marina TaxID=29655 RepID=A0A0K9PNY1_ZOSMR|nr:hypothetical protein ZOSMA_202G00370 [Zostera marina]